MVALQIEKFSIDKKETIGNGNDKWFTVASFWISAPRKVLGLFPKRTTYGHQVFLTVSSKTITTNPDPTTLGPDLFAKRITLEKYNESQIQRYVEEKVKEAAKTNNIKEAFDYLARFFDVDDLEPF